MVGQDRQHRANTLARQGSILLFTGELERAVAEVLFSELTDVLARPISPHIFR